MTEEEFKKELLADLKELKRMAAEAKQYADELEKSELNLLSKHQPRLTIEHLQGYLQQVRDQQAAQKAFWKLPWWKRLFTRYPAFIA
jgi:hypothetical protein